MIKIVENIRSCRLSEYVKRLILLTIAFILLNGSFIFSQTKSPPPKMRIAVLNFQSYNCPPEFGRALSEMVAGRLFDNELFTLLERNNIELLMKERGISGNNDLDNRDALRVGKMLSVDKIAVGSVSRFGDYNIEVRIIDVRVGTVDLRVPAKVEDDEDFDDTARFIAGRIDFHYHGVSPVSELFDIAVTAAYLQPLGDLAGGTARGFGSHLHVYGNKLLYNIAGRNARMLFLAGYYRLYSDFHSIRYLRMAPLGAFLGCRYPLSGSVDFYPYAGGGYIVTQTSYDTIEERTYEKPVYRDRYYYNPFVSLRSEFHLRLGYRVFLMITPFYTVFFEPGRLGQMAAADLGLKILF
jgi:hypothetical protein